MAPPSARSAHRAAAGGRRDAEPGDAPRAEPKPEPKPAPESALKPPPMHRLIGYHCRRAFFHVQPFSDPRMSAFALRPADFAVLSLLGANPGISQKQVAQGIGVAPPNLTPVIERLEARKLLARRRSQRDGRMQTFSLTDQGRALCALAEEAASRIEDEAASALSGEERETLQRLLCKLYGAQEGVA